MYEKRMSFIPGSFNDGYNFAQKEFEEIYATLGEYLKYKSADGTTKKNELRQKLKELMKKHYD